MKLSVLLKSFREEKGLTIRELSVTSGVPASTISEVERGANKTKISTLEKLSLGLQLNKKDRRSIFSSLMPQDIQDEMVSNGIILNNNSLLELISIPIFDSVSAGSGYFSNETPIGVIGIPVEYNNSYYDDVIAITVKGDSMEPTLPNGAVVIVKRGLEVEIGDIGVFFLNGELGETVVKRLKNKNGVYHLESDNKIYSDILIKTDDIFKCGKVIRIVINKTEKIKKRPLLEEIENLDDEELKIIETILNGFKASKK